MPNGAVQLAGRGAGRGRGRSTRNEDTTAKLKIEPASPLPLHNPLWARLGLIYGHQSGEQRAAISKKILNGVAGTGRTRQGVVACLLLFCGWVAATPCSALLCCSPGRAWQPAWVLEQPRLASSRIASHIALLLDDCARR